MHRSIVASVFAVGLASFLLPYSASAGSDTTGTGIGKGSPNTQNDGSDSDTKGTGIGKGSPSVEADTKGTGIGKGSPSMLLPGSLSDSGTVLSVDAGGMTIACHCGTGDWTFPITGSTDIRRGDAAATIGDIAAGDRVQLWYHFSGETAFTDVIQITP